MIPLEFQRGHAAIPPNFPGVEHEWSEFWNHCHLSGVGKQSCNAKKECQHFRIVGAERHAGLQGQCLSNLTKWPSVGGIAQALKCFLVESLIFTDLGGQS